MGLWCVLKKKEDLLKDVDLNRLCEAVMHSRLVQRDFRIQHLNITKQLAGHRYSLDSAPKTRFLNMIGLYVNVVGRSLISRHPRVMLSTDERKDEPAVHACQEWENKQFETMNFAHSLKRWVLDAMISIGVGMTTLALPSDCARLGWLIDPGEPFFAHIDPDDFVYDINAHKFSECQYMGHRFRAVKKSIEESDLYDEEVRMNLETSPNSRFNAEGDEKVSAIGRGYYWLQGEYKDMVDLWSIYLPEDRLVITMPDTYLTGPTAWRSGPKVKPLRVQKWIGHPRGPYNLLTLGTVPGNPWPKGPLLDLIDLDEQINENYRKLTRQAARHKQNTLVGKGNVEDNKRYQDAKDGDMLPVDDPNSFKEIASNGPNQNLFVFLRDQVDRFMEMAGNLRTVGGLAPQAQTARQEDLLQQQSSGQISDQQEAVAVAVEDVCQRLHWYFWNHPTKVMKTKFQVEGLPDVWMTRELHPYNAKDMMGPDGMMRTPLKRDGEIPKIRIDPWSLRYMTPSQKAGIILNFIQQVYAPLAQVAMQQGYSIDFGELQKIISELQDVPELQRIIQTTEVPDPESAPAMGDQGGMPQETTRNYVRRSLGGDSYKAQQAEMQSLLEAGAGRNGSANFSGAK